MVKIWRRKPSTEKAISQIAQKIYQNRKLLNRSGDAEQDWARAEKISGSLLRRTLFVVNDPLIKLEKHFFEPISRSLRNSAVFDIVERLSPSLEAVGVLLIPLALFSASRVYEKQREAQEIERLQQDTVQNYLGHLSEIFLNADGDLRDERNQRIRTVLEASTVTLLKDPNLDFQRKGQIISSLSIMELVQGEFSDDVEVEDKPPVISLENTDLSSADLSQVNLSYAELSRSDFSDSILRSVNLEGAVILGADFRSANLRNANLRYTKHGVADKDILNFSLEYTNFSNAYLHEASFSWADLDGTNFREARLTEVNFVESALHRVSFVLADLTKAYIADASIRRSDFRYADLTRAAFRGSKVDDSDFSNANLQEALFENMSVAAVNFEDADLREAVIISSDLRDVSGLHLSQLVGSESPFICNSPLPKDLSSTIDKDRDCDRLPSILYERYSRFTDLDTLEEAEKIVNDSRNKQWN